MILLSCFYISALILIVYVCPVCHISPVVSPQKEQEVNPVFLFCFFFIQNYIDASNFVLAVSSPCPPSVPSKQRKESETQCQTDSKFDLEVVESKEPVAMETRSSEYVSRYVCDGRTETCSV